MRKLCLLFAAIVVPLLCLANGWDSDYARIETSIRQPQFANREFNIKKFGASTSADAAHNQRSINLAISACSNVGGGKVIVPEGFWLTGAIELKSGVNLVLEKNAVLQFVFQPELYPIVKTRWEGLDCWNLSPCVYAFKARNVAITGQGVIDGGGTNETWWKWCGAAKYGWKEGVISQRNGSRARLLQMAEDGVPADQRRFGPEDGLRPQLINFNQCDGVLIEDVTLLRSPFWVIHPLLSKNITVRGVQINNDGPNGDGCDPESCDGVLIENCYFNTGDDCIAIKSGRNNDGRLWNRPSQNIIVRNCEMKNGHGGVVIGSEISGGCRNVYAENNVMDSPNLDRVIRIKTNSCRGGIIENIYARNIIVGQCGESVLKINLDYEHNEICCRGFNPTVRNVSIDNITCNKSKYGVQIIALYDSVKVYNINVKNCRFNGVADGNLIKGKVRDIKFEDYYLNDSLCPSVWPYNPGGAEPPIDRQAVVTRNHPKVSRVDSLSSFTVGNGRIAFTVDATGLQSFPEYYKNGIPLTTMSEWGWHSFPNNDSLTVQETQRAMNLGHGHDEVYAVEYKKGGRNQAATEYFRVNPHRLNLGTVGLTFKDETGKPLSLNDITNLNQEFQLWDGKIETKYKIGGEDVDVTTFCIPTDDALYARVKSELLEHGRAAIDIKFPYPTGRHADDAADWNSNDKHTSAIIEYSPNRAVIERELDGTKCYVTVSWDGKARISETSRNEFKLSTDDNVLAFSVAYSQEKPSEPSAAFSYDQALKANLKQWPAWWNKGAIVDFGECTDPRAAELERRVILSQFLTFINCANSTPPQETGLTYNSWFGRPHLEMTWWHGVDFSLWNRPEVLERLLDWYNEVAYPKALGIASRQGFKGARWMKMTDPEAGEAPSNTGSFLIWQQPHYIYMAEEMYRANPSEGTLKKYGKQVEATAEFMADYALACAKGDEPIKLYGQTAMQESMSKDFSYHHPFEQAYWLYGLQKAQQWRERQGKARNEKWDEVIERLAPLHEADGIYTAGAPIKPFDAKSKSEEFDPYVTPEQVAKTSISAEDFALKSRSDHPAVLGACGLLPKSALYEEAVMQRTLDHVMANWNWPTTWGWDYGMIAMCAARLGRPDTALEALMIDKGKNTYLVNGHNFQEPKRLRLYLPGNGSLLDAVAMMCAGWDGSEGVNPGFPKDGKWNVRWEGLKKIQ